MGAVLTSWSLSRRAELLLLRTRCTSVALDRPAHAETHFRDAVALLDPNFVRERAEWLCWLATARVSAGSVEQASATAREAATIIRRLDPPRVQQQLADFRRAASPYASSTAVRDFDARCCDLLTPQPPKYVGGRSAHSQFF